MSFTPLHATWHDRTVPKHFFEKKTYLYKREKENDLWLKKSISLISQMWRSCELKPKLFLTWTVWRKKSRIFTWNFQWLSRNMYIRCNFLCFFGTFKHFLVTTPGSYKWTVLIQALMVKLLWIKDSIPPLFMEHKASNQVILGKLTWLKAQYLLNKNVGIFKKKLKSSK